MESTKITICGARIAGIATAYYLAVKYRQKQIVLIDKHQPLPLTTSKSGENFRVCWPQPCMAACSAGELCAATMADKELPSYAPYFHPGRYEDRDLMAKINQVNSDGQL